MEVEVEVDVKVVVVVSGQCSRVRGTARNEREGAWVGVKERREGEMARGREGERE
jgi:ribosomal protein L24E